jgi:hypothetical protein
MIRPRLRPDPALHGPADVAQVRGAGAVLAMKSLELPAVAAAAASPVGLPVAASQAGLVAAQFIASSVRAHHTAEQQRRSAAGCLLGLRKELSPRGVLDRLRRMFRHASGESGARSTAP